MKQTREEDCRWLIQSELATCRSLRAATNAGPSRLVANRRQEPALQAHHVVVLRRESVASVYKLNHIEGALVATKQHCVICW